MAESPRILVVDDNDDLRRATVRLLSQAGYDVVEAAGGEECLRLARAGPPDLVLLDVAMPAPDGIEVCRRLKADPDLAGAFVVHCSAHQTAAEDVARGLDSGADGYLARPIGNRELLARVQGFLRHKCALDELRASERRHRERVEAMLQSGYDAEMRSLHDSSTARPSRITGQTLAVAPLSESAPQAFAGLREEYDRLLELALEQRIYRIDNACSQGLRALAQRMFQLGAGARDVTELHYVVLEARSSREPPPRARGFLEIGRLAVLELMGHLLSAYRNPHVVARDVPARRGSAPETSQCGALDAGADPP